MENDKIRNIVHAWAAAVSSEWDEWDKGYADGLRTAVRYLESDIDWRSLEQKCIDAFRKTGGYDSQFYKIVDEFVRNAGFDFIK